MERSRHISRWKAGAVHLGLSLCVAAAAIAVVLLVWYPAPLAMAEGVDEIVLILIGVDVAIGPMMTTIIFAPGKKGLRHDMIVIALLQMGALCYGIFTISEGRPAYLVFNTDRFTVVAATEVDRESLKKATTAGAQGLPWLGPRIVATLLPENPKERSRLVEAFMASGKDLPMLPEMYVPYERARHEAVKQIRPLDELRDVNRLDAVAWKNFVESLPSAGRLGYLPLSARINDGAVIVDRETAAVVRIVPLEPGWQREQQRN